MNRRSIFTIGGTVQAGSGRYLPRQVDEELLALCRAGTYAFVLAARQMGKSSLMVRTAQQLAQGDIHSVIIDLSQIGVQIAPEAWYFGLLTTIEDALDLDTDVYEWWEDHAHLGEAQRLTRFFQDVLLEEVGGRIVIFIDEIDSTLSLPFTDDFFAALRYVYNARSEVPAFERLSFVLVGVATPSDLISDPKRTPFNIGRQVDVAYFTEEEAMPLAEGFQLPPSQARQALRWVLKWTGGHPYLTQRLCYVLAEQQADGITEADVDRVVAAIYFGEKSEEDSNLRFVHDMLTRRADDPIAVLSTYQQILRGGRVQDDKQSTTISHLKLAGIVDRQNGYLKVSNAIYARAFDRAWVKEQWPEHWIKRIPPVVRVGSAVFVAALAVIALLLGFFLSREAGLRSEALVARDSTASVLVIARAARDSTESALLLAEMQRRIAEVARDSTLAALETAAEQRRAAISAAAEAERQSQIAQANEQLAQEQRRIAEAAQDSTLAALEVAAEQRQAATRARRQTLGLALANEAVSQQETGNNVLGALLAREAFLFNEQSGGTYLNEVYDALRRSLNSLQPGRGGPLVLGRHDDWVTAVAYSPDGRWIASADNEGQVLLWPPADSAVTPRALRSREGIMYLAFDDGGKLQGYSERPSAEEAERSVLVWDPGTGRREEVRSEDWTMDPREVRSPDGIFRASGGEDGMVRLENVRTGAVHVLLGHEGPVTALAFSPDGTTLASGSGDRSIRLWSVNDPARKPVLLQAHTHWVRSLAFGPDGATLLSGGADKALRVWKVAPARLAEDICTLVGRPLTREEWNRFVGQDISYETYTPCRADAAAALHE